MKTKAQILKDNGLDIRIADQEVLISVSKSMTDFADQETASLRSEIASLRSRLDECRKKQMMG